MPKLVLTVPDTNQSVTRPVVYDITRQIFEMTGIPSNTTIFYPEDMERAAQPGSVLGVNSDINVSAFTNKITVEVEENYEQDRILSSAVYRPENLFIFRDDRIDTSIKPAYSSTDMTLSFHYRHADKNAATRWRDDIKTRISMMRDVRIHDLSYYYLIPPEFLVILKELHRMREAVAGYGEDYETFFKANATQRASVLTTMIGTQGQWGISESQMRVVGYFDWDGAPEKGSKEDEGDTWTISFSYKFKYDKPVACVMDYPLVIHNQVVNQKFRPDKPVDTVERHRRSYSMSASHFHTFEKGVSLIGIPQGVAVPDYDEFIPSQVLPRTQRVFTAMTTLNELDRTELLSLNNLGDINLKPAILEFLRGEVPYLTKARLSIFGIQLYRGIDLLHHDALMVKSDLSVVSKEPLSLRHYYHVRLSMVTDFTQLTEASLNRAREHGTALQMILDALDPTLVEKGLMPNLIGKNYISKAALDAAIQEMVRADIAEGDNQIRQFNTVENLFITSYSRP